MWFLLLFVLVRVLQRNRTNGIYMEIYYEDLTHVILEAEKSPGLQAGHPGKPVVCNSRQPGKLADGVNPSSRAGEKSQLKQGARGEFVLPLLCAQTLRDWRRCSGRRWRRESTSLSPHVQC